MWYKIALNEEKEEEQGENQSLYLGTHIIKLKK